MNPAAFFAIVIAATPPTVPCEDSEPVAVGEVSTCDGEVHPAGTGVLLLSWRERALKAEADLKAALAREKTKDAACEAVVDKWVSHARDMATLAREPVIVQRGLPWWGSALICGGAFGAGVAVGK